MIPMMTKNEWEFLKSYLHSDQIMLEYGSGISTGLLAKLVNTLYSIEHYKDWYNRVVKEIKGLDNVQYLYIPKESGAPKEDRNLDPKFYEKYINWPKTQDVIFDVVFIDGRARQWVAESILDNIRDDSLVFIHDWNPKLKPKYRMRYKRILDLYDIVKSENMMTLLRKK
jgi:hypothetical protein